MNKNFKKIFAVALAAMLIFGLCACNGGGDDKDKKFDSDKKTGDKGEHTDIISGQEFCAAYLGSWTNDDDEFITFDYDETYGYFMWGEWNAGFGRGFGKVENAENLGDGLYKLTVCFPATEESEEYDALPEETIEFYIDISSVPDGFMVCDVYADDFIAYYYIENKQLENSGSGSDTSAEDMDLICSGSPWTDDASSGLLMFNMDGTGYIDEKIFTDVPSGSFGWTCENGTICITGSDGKDFWVNYGFGNGCLLLNEYYTGYVLYSENNWVTEQLTSDSYDALIGKWYCEDEDKSVELTADGKYITDIMTTGWNAEGNKLYTEIGYGWCITFIGIDKVSDTWYSEVESYRENYVRAK